MMTKAEYLEMINSQLREAEENMKITEKSYREAKAKHDALLTFKESYIEWVMSKEEKAMNIKLIKFYTTWCGPCKTMSMLLNQVDLNGVELVEVDAEEKVELAEQYRVSSVPVLVFEKNGEELDRINGVMPPEVIQEKLAGLRVL